MRKILVIFVILFIALSGFGAYAINAENKYKPNIINLSTRDDLDQYQDETTENTYVFIGQVPIPEAPLYIQVAQSFIPTKDILTRVELYIGKNSTTTYPYYVAIRDNLTKDDLTSISIGPDQILTENISWIEFDFADILVTTGQTYYVVSYTKNSTDNWYAMAANNNSESYPYGHAWFSYDNGTSWTNESDESSESTIETNYNKGASPIFDRVLQWDLCFKTYGRENNAPGETNIEGPSSGKPNTEYDFILTATDSDGDDIKYFVDWGDGDTDSSDLVASNTPVTLSHSWSQKGTYTITVKAQDEYGAEGPESSGNILIPRAKETNKPIFKVLQNYPYLAEILVKILIKYGL